MVLQCSCHGADFLFSTSTQSTSVACGVTKLIAIRSVSLTDLGEYGSFSDHLQVYSFQQVNDFW